MTAVRPDPGAKIVEVATRFLGLHETAQNAAWDDPATAGQDQSALDLKRMLLEVGWAEGWPYCYEGATEILTESGWIRFDELGCKHGAVAQVSAEGLVTFAVPDGYVYKRHVGRFAWCKHRDLDLVTDDGHQFWGSWQRSNNRLAPIKALTSELRIPPAKSASEGLERFSDVDLEFIAAFVADGFLHRQHGKLLLPCFGVSMERKIAKLESWKPRSRYRQSKLQKGNAQKALKTVFHFALPWWWQVVFPGEYKEVSWSWLLGLSVEQLRVFLRSCCFWSGGIRKGGVEIRTARRSHADAFCAAAALAGFQPKCYRTTNRFGFNPGGHLWHVRYADRDGRRRTVKSRHLSFYDGEGDLFCVSVPEKRLMIRDKAGNVLICGNCASFVEAVWRTAYRELDAPPALLGEIGLKLTPSVMQSLTNWQDRITREPVPGAIFFLQKGRAWQGHAGIVVLGAGARFATIEGNTSPDPADAAQDREGDGIFRRTRSLDWTEKPGLWLRGFLAPLEVG